MIGKGSSILFFAIAAKLFAVHFFHFLLIRFFAEPFKPGCYALKMVGTLPGDMVEALPRNMRERYRHLQESSDAYAEE